MFGWWVKGRGPQDPFPRVKTSAACLPIETIIAVITFDRIDSMVWPLLADARGGSSGSLQVLKETPVDQRDGSLLTRPRGRP